MTNPVLMVNTEHSHSSITSVHTRHATELARVCRSHWGIENGLHWCLDVNFREDHNQTSARNGAQN